MESTKIRVSVKGVRSAKDAYGRTLTIIDFVEPIDWTTPHMVPSEIGEGAGMVAIQIQKSVQHALESAGAPREMLRLTVVLTVEELEAFGIEPYPNERYYLQFQNGALVFDKVRGEGVED